MLASYSNATCDDRNFEKADQCGCRVKDSFIPLANGALPPYLAGADAITEMPIFTHEILLIDERIKNKYRGKEFEGKNLLIESMRPQEMEFLGNSFCANSVRSEISFSLQERKASFSPHAVCSASSSSQSDVTHLLSRRAEIKTKRSPNHWLRGHDRCLVTLTIYLSGSTTMLADRCTATDPGGLDAN